MLSASLLVLVGAFAGGLVSGLTGFGTGMTALPIWLVGLTPALASPLVVICSIIGQLQTLPAIWHAIEWRRCLPFIAGGLTGYLLRTYFRVKNDMTAHTETLRPSGRLPNLDRLLKVFGFHIPGGTPLYSFVLIAIAVWILARG